MNKRIHLRNAGIAALVIIVLALATMPWAPPVALAQQSSITLISGPTSIDPGGIGNYRFRITNNTTAIRTFSLSAPGNSGLVTAFPGGTQITVNGNGGTGEFDLQVTVPSSASSGSRINLTLTATSSSPDSLQLSTIFTVVVSGPTPTTTPTITNTPAPATSTPTRGPTCGDGFEPDNNPGSARVIDVQTSQEHAICPSGDEDWLLFGGVAGKVYTIDISRMDPGIDLSLELFDENMNSIAFNDDFFNRDPANPNPGDIRPRITIRIPADGRYYIKVRDNAGRGGVNYIYVIALVDESFGPTPTLVREVCLDLFEQDGLPEQARLITSNEIQENRRLCPSGDADWVTFFGKAGKRYILFTDSRRYVGDTKVNGDLQAGADTVIVLTDRDGVSIIDVNDDIPGGNTLDSQIEFIPEVDGFYYVQVKNIGDIGGQFIRYDMVLLLCLPGQTDCGRPSSGGQNQPVNPATPPPTATSIDEFQLDPTRTPPPPTPTATP